MIRRSSTPGLTAALATIVVLLAACSEDPGPRASVGDDSPTPAPTESSPTQPAPSPTGWTPLITEDSGEGILPAGRYGMTANGYPDMPYAVVEVPQGFSNFDGWTLFKEGLDEEAGAFTGMGYWTISGVFPDPCGNDFVEVGNSVAEVAGALQAQERSLVTEPVPVTIDGYQGLYLELQMPKDIDLGECGQYDVWSSDPGGGRYMEAPGQLDRNWILDVEGDVVVLQITASPGVPRAAREQLTGMVESVDFIAWD
jgi:hypothetical protein